MSTVDVFFFSFIFVSPPFSIHHPIPCGTIELGITLQIDTVLFSDPVYFTDIIFFHLIAAVASENICHVAFTDVS